MRELDYQPDQFARSLRKIGPRGKLWTGNLGFVFINASAGMLEQPFVAPMIESLNYQASSQGFSLVLATTPDTESIPAIIRDQKVEGCILYGEPSSDLLERLNAQMPVVMVGTLQSSATVSCINVDNRTGVASAVRYLAGLGHRRIAFVNPYPDHVDFVERMEGYRAGLRQAGLPIDSALERADALVVKIGPATPQSAPPSMEHLVFPLLDLAERPTAIIVANDWQAVGVYRALAKRSVRIPEDISVIGFDNDQRVCESLMPPLTSIEYPSANIGQCAAEILFEFLKSRGDSSRSLLIKPTMVERQSCRSLI